MSFEDEKARVRETVWGPNKRERYERMAQLFAEGWKLCYEKIKEFDEGVSIVDISHEIAKLLNISDVINEYEDYFVTFDSLKKLFNKKVSQVREGAESAVTVRKNILEILRFVLAQLMHEAIIEWVEKSKSGASASLFSKYKEETIDGLRLGVIISSGRETIDHHFAAGGKTGSNHLIALLDFAAFSEECSQSDMDGLYSSVVAIAAQNHAHGANMIKALSGGDEEHYYLPQYFTRNRKGVVGIEAKTLQILALPVDIELENYVRVRKSAKSGDTIGCSFLQVPATDPEKYDNAMHEFWSYLSSSSMFANLLVPTAKSLRKYLDKEVVRYQADILYGPAQKTDVKKRARQLELSATELEEQVKKGLMFFGLQDKAELTHDQWHAVIVYAVSALSDDVTSI